MASSPPTFDELQKIKKKWKIRDVTFGVMTKCRNYLIKVASTKSMNAVKPAKTQTAST